MTHARTFTPGDLIETERDAEALPPGTLVADRDGDPVLRLARGGWHRLAPSQGRVRWSKQKETPVYRPWRVLALGCSDDMPAEVAIRAALAEPRVAGWDLVGREVSIDEVPIGAVARRVGGESGDVVLRRAPGLRGEGAHFLLSTGAEFVLQHEAQVCANPEARAGRWRILAVGLPRDAAPETALQAAGYQVEGNAVRAPEEAAPPAAPAVGDEVSLERLPVGAVAGRAGDLGELVIKRRAPGPSDLGAQFVTSAPCDGRHLIWGARGAAWPMRRAAWRILALDVSPEATAEEAVAAAMPALEAHGYERRGDRIWRRDVAPAPVAAVAVGDEIDAADLPPGGVGRRGDDRGTDFSGRFLARRADGQGWWFGPAGCDPGDVDGRDLIAGCARWGARGADRGVDRVRVVALGATDEELRDSAWLRRVLGDVPGSAWATPRVEVAAPALASGMQVALHEAPAGWLVAEVGGEGRVWLRREGGGGRRVLTAHGWLGASTGTWQWPVAGDGACSVHAAGSAPVRLVAPLPDAPRGDYDRAARAAVWRASEVGLCQVTPALLPDLAFGLAAGALGPKMRDRVACADSSEAMARALPHAREGGALAVWALGGTVALLGDAWGHAAVIAAECARLISEGDPSLTTIVLRGLAGARRADVQAWLSDGDASVGWRSGGLSCALRADAGGYAWSTQDASGSAETRAACAAALVDHLLHVAQRALFGTRRTVDSCHVWTASAAQADGPRSLGPLVVAPGSAAGLVLGTSSRAVAVAAADVARLARSGKAASQRAFAVAPYAPAGGDVEAARAVLRRLDAAGLLP